MCHNKKCVLLLIVYFIQVIFNINKGINGKILDIFKQKKRTQMSSFKNTKKVLVCDYSTS